MANKDIVNKEEGLAFLDNDTELYKLLIESFLFDNNFQIETMENLVQQANPENPKSMVAAAKCIHYIKGAARQLCANPLAQEAEKLEKILNGKETGDIISKKNKIKTLYIQTKETLENILQEL
ncbi:MAG: Hpt domain-containing protein [Spirochaetaceae bacterium]|nr:Hpt domain-containing protein [Spirochaetaceae bacterium]